MSLPVFLTATSRLHPANAAVALLVTPESQYVMQLRDPKPEIFYPDHWGCFGGAVESGEKPEEALVRELREELEFEAGPVSEFTSFNFDFSRLGQGQVCRVYYEVPVSPEALARFVLHEGAAFRPFSAEELLQQPRVTPYDAFAVWLHCRRARFQT